jgi:hypothetical protein
VIDFEWALSGAPLADFVPEETWEGQCAGSREWVYAGYEAVRPLEDGHHKKLKVYKLLLALETVVDVARAGDWAAVEGQRRRLAMLMGEL